MSSAFKTVANGKTSVVCNPVAASDRMLGSSVSFSSDHFSLNGSNSVKSYVLKIQVSIRVSTGITGRSPHKGDVNSDLGALIVACINDSFWIKIVYAHDFEFFLFIPFF